MCQTRMNTGFSGWHFYYPYVFLYCKCKKEMRKRYADWKSNDNKMKKKVSVLFVCPPAGDLLSVYE